MSFEKYFDQVDDLVTMTPGTEDAIASVSDRGTASRQAQDLRMQRAQALALLAVAEQQRTANWIAWLAHLVAQGDLPDEAAGFARRIEEALA